MSDLDAVLQEKIAELESGQQIESLLTDLQEEASELEPLLRLAAAVRSVPHPTPTRAQVAAQRYQVMAAAERKTCPDRRPEAGRPWRSFLPQVNHPWRMGAVAAALVMGLVVLVSLGMWLGGRGYQTARLENVVGQVEVAESAQEGTWKNISNGYRVQSGDRLRTVGASSVTVAYYEGTQSFVGANTDLTLTQVDGAAGDILQVELTQNSGATTHKVIPFNGKKSLFLVHTPSGTASVHGTSFDVKVKEDGQSQYSVNTGEVRVTNAESEVTVLPGQITSTIVGEPPAQPSYQFIIQGTLLDNEGAIWAVSGLPFSVTDETQFSGSLEIGKIVKVSGLVIAEGTRTATSVEEVMDNDQAASFTGTIETMAGDAWQIGGNLVLVDDQTVLGDGLEIGAPVRVIFNTLGDGNWLALRIEALAETPEEPAETPAATATETEAVETPEATTTSTETVTLTPEETNTPEVEQTPEATAFPAAPEEPEAGICTGADPQPTGMTLAQRYGVPYTEIMGWFCQHYGFGEIDLAYSLASISDMTVEQIFALRSSGLGWGEIKKQVAPDNDAKWNQKNKAPQTEDGDQSDLQNADQNSNGKNDQDNQGNKNKQKDNNKKKP